MSNHDEHRRAVQKVLHGEIQGTLEADADGNYMSVQNLKDIQAMAAQLAQHIQPGAPMEDWVEDKVSAARQMLSDLQRFYAQGGGRKKKAANLSTRLEVDLKGTTLTVKAVVVELVTSSGSLKSAARDLLDMDKSIRIDLKRAQAKLMQAISSDPDSMGFIQAPRPAVQLDEPELSSDFSDYYAEGRLTITMGVSRDFNLQMFQRGVEKILRGDFVMRF